MQLATGLSFGEKYTPISRGWKVNISLEFCELFTSPQLWENYSGLQGLINGHWIPIASSPTHFLCFAGLKLTHLTGSAIHAFDHEVVHVRGAELVERRSMVAFINPLGTDLRLPTHNYYWYAESIAEGVRSGRLALLWGTAKQASEHPGSSLPYCIDWLHDLFRPMARPLSIEYEGAVYHITSRGDKPSRWPWTMLIGRRLLRCRR